MERRLHRHRDRHEHRCHRVVGVAVDPPVHRGPADPPGLVRSVQPERADVTVTNESWNGAVAPGGSVSLGFNASHSGSNPDPVGFAVGGAACAWR